VRTGAGCYEAGPAALAAVRAAIDDERTGTELERIVGGLVDGGWQLAGETLKTAPRGFDQDHPRIGLLRHKSLTLAFSHGFEPVIHTTGLLDVVREDWRTLRPFVEWVAERTAGR
jgi:uncharacterized protein (DUF2461 family)